MRFRTLIEPSRIHSTQAIKQITPEEREAALVRAGYNLFRLHADEVLIDLLTDSGTGAMSSCQWAAMMDADESYAGSRSFYRFQDVVRGITGLAEVIPTHQGRAAERILFSVLVKPGQVVPNNTHFDTTRANIEYCGAEARDLVIPEGRIPAARHPFKGNMDVAALDATIAEVGRDRVPLVMVTVTNNSSGGQPVSLANLRAVRAVCDRYGIPLYLDACRFAENAYFIKLREPGYADKTPRAIARELFGLADGCTMSAKNGGLAGYDLEAVATGLEEALDEDYLKYRLRSTAYLAEKAEQAGVPVVQPPGGHAVYLDARALLPHVPPAQYPAQALAVELYRVGGVRGVEIGSVMFGRRHADGGETPAPLELVRLAVPRRTYTQSHIDYVAEVIAEVARRKERVRGYRIVEQAPWLRHFTARFEPI